MIAYIYFIMCLITTSGRSDIFFLLFLKTKINNIQFVFQSRLLHKREGTKQKTYLNWMQVFYVTRKPDNSSSVNKMCKKNKF